MLQPFRAIFVQNFNEFRSTERFYEIPVHARIECPFAIFSKRVRSDCYDRRW